MRHILSFPPSHETLQCSKNSGEAAKTYDVFEQMRGKKGSTGVTDECLFRHATACGHSRGRWIGLNRGI
jgi:hypothetical protein